MLKLNKVAQLIYLALALMIGRAAHADTVFSLTAPTAVKVSELDETKEFYKCSLVRRGPNFNPVKAGPTIFSYTAPKADDNAVSLIKDKTKKVYRCELQEQNSTNGRLRKVKDNS